jgi:ubiquinone biosynthesis protein
VNRGGQKRLRFLRAYWVTMVVISSYTVPRLWEQFQSRAAVKRTMRRRHVRNAKRIERTIMRLQGLFIKVGQLFSVMTNFLPAAFRNELEGLQDSVPARSYASVESRFLEDFGKKPDELFSEFERSAVAAASISQVHVARLKTGEKVAVKVQYPDINRMVRSDLKTFRRILKIIGYFLPAHGLDVVFAEISQMLMAELDFTEEARNLRIITANFADEEELPVAFPDVIDDLSTSHILTTSYIEGIKVSDVDHLRAAGYDTGQLGRQIVDIYCKQIFEHGVYHADPHPGNVLVGADGQIHLIDFGAVATLRPEMQRGIARFLQAILHQDTEKIAEALREMGFISHVEDDEVFDRIVTYFHERFQESVRIDSFNLDDVKLDPDRALEHLLALRKMDIGVGELSKAFQVPKDWILLERTILLLTGLCTLLDPTIRPIELIRPYLKGFVLGDHTDWSTFVLDSGKELFIQYAGLPAELRKFLSKASTGRLEVRVRGAREENRKLYAVGQQIVMTIVGVSSVFLATWLHLNGEHELRDVALWAASGSGVLLLWSLWRNRNRNQS